MYVKTTIMVLLIAVAIFTSSYVTSAKDDRIPVTYKSLIDDHGFYKVINTTANRYIPYQNRTLNIYKNDTIIWVHDEESDRRYTVISKEKLWDNGSGLLAWRSKEFGYTFTKVGTYEIYIKEFPLLRQKIVVRSIENINIINKTEKKKSNSTSKINTVLINKTEKKKSNSTSSSENNNKASGFEIFSVFTVILLIYLCKKRKLVRR